MESYRDSPEHELENTAGRRGNARRWLTLQQRTGVFFPNAVILTH